MNKIILCAVSVFRKNCLYMAPMSQKENKAWCAFKGAYVVPGNECEEYEERR